MAMFFEDLDSDAVGRNQQKPFWALDFNDEKAVLEWLNTELSSLQQQAVERHEEQKKNLATYRGISYGGIGNKTRDESAQDGTTNRKSKNPRVIYNHTVDIVEGDVARMTKYRGAIAATPASDDNSDRIVARVSEEIIESFWDQVDIDNVLQHHRRRTRIHSESYIAPLWNQNAGPYDPDWLVEAFRTAGIKGDPRTMKRSELRKAMKKMKEFPRLPLIDPETGKQMTGSDGKDLWIDRPMRRGAVVYRGMLSWDVFLQRVQGGDFELVEYCFFRERLKTDTVRAMHPKEAEKIKDGTDRCFDIDALEDVDRHGEIEVWHFYHKSTDMLDQGRYIKFVTPAILKNRTNPYSGWDNQKILPLVRSVDIPTPGVLNGDATVTHIRGPQAVYNNLVSLRVRNRFMFSHPKWWAPKGSVTTETLANNTTVGYYKGAVPPILSQPALAEGNESEMMANAEDVMQKIGGRFGVSRGDPPAGLTAMVALQFMDEQENDRANVGVQSQSRAVEQLALQTLWLIADNYDTDRLADILGQNRAAQLKSFEMSNLHDIGDLRIKTSTALPQQKSARNQFIMDMREKAPTVMNDDRMVDFLDLGDDKRMRSAATVALRKADGENESLMNGATCAAPEQHEFHLQHYRAHMTQMNEQAYANLPKTARNHFVDHVMAHEMFLFEASLKNPQFGQLLLQEFPMFPVYFKPEEAPPVDAPALPPLGSMPAGDMQGAPPVLGEDPGLPPGAESAVPQPEALPPGAEALTPTGE